MRQVIRSALRAPCAAPVRFSTSSSISSAYPHAASGTDARDQGAFGHRRLQSLGDVEHGFLTALRNGRIWLLILIFFCIIAANSSLTF